MGNFRLNYDILDDIEPVEKNISREVAERPDNELWSDDKSELSGTLYNLKIRLRMTFTYNLEEDDVEKLKDDFSTRMLHMYYADKNLDDISKFRIFQFSHRKFALSVAFNLSRDIKPVDFLMLNVKIVNIVAFFKRCSKQVDFMYPYQNYWNVAKMYEVKSKSSSTQEALNSIEYGQWKSPEAFSDYVWKFVIKPEDDNSFIDEKVSLQWVERLAKRLNKTLTYRELRNKFPFIKK